MPTRSVFLVEDERAIADMYRLGLEMRGYEVSVQDDGPPFFDALETALPDIVILDWNLPTLTGGEILQRLRLDERTHRLGVFILSNVPGSHFAAEVASRLGALAWLEKKTRTTPAALAEAVAQAFEELAAGRLERRPRRLMYRRATGHSPVPLRRARTDAMGERGWKSVSTGRRSRREERLRCQPRHPSRRRPWRRSRTTATVA